MKKLEKIGIKLIPVVTDVLRTVLRRLEKRLGELKIGGRHEISNSIAEIV